MHDWHYIVLLQAASDAYDSTLAPIHTYFVRMAIKTSMYLLPDRATFIASIGETGSLLPADVILQILQHYINDTQCRLKAASVPPNDQVDTALNKAPMRV